MEPDPGKKWHGSTTLFITTGTLYMVKVCANFQPYMLNYVHIRICYNGTSTVKKL